MIKEAITATVILSLGVAGVSEAGENNERNSGKKTSAPGYTVISPIFSQSVSFTLPAGFTTVWEDGNKTNYLREAVPTGETVESWTQMVTAGPDVEESAAPPAERPAYDAEAGPTQAFVRRQAARERAERVRSRQVGYGPGTYARINELSRGPRQANAAAWNARPGPTSNVALWNGRPGPTSNAALWRSGLMQGGGESDDEPEVEHRRARRVTRRSTRGDREGGADMKETNDLLKRIEENTRPEKQTEPNRPQIARNAHV